MNATTATAAVAEVLDPQRLRDIKSRVDNLRGYL